MDPLRNQYGSKMGPEWTHLRSTRDPRRNLYGSLRGPKRSLSRTQDPLRNYVVPNGSNVDPLMIQVGSEKEPLWFQDEPRRNPSGFPTEFPTVSNNLFDQFFLILNIKDSKITF